MKKVKFEFGDGNIYDGLTDGSTWNGFANIWVENNVYRQILNNYDHSMYDYKESELFGIEPTEDGLYAFTYGFSNTIINEDKQNPYLEWSEDSIGDERFELEQWIIQDWLSSREQDSTDEDSQYYKYCQLNDAMEILQDDEFKRNKIINSLKQEKNNKCIVDNCENDADHGSVFCKDCGEEEK